jgi:signal transduction histidine kinase
MSTWLSSGTLFRQIVALLAAMMLAFVVLESGMVVALYASDRDGLAQDVIDMQAERIFASPPANLAGLPSPEGVRSWSYEITRRPSAGARPFGDDADLISWTRLDSIPGGTRITGVRSSGAGASERWVRIHVDMAGPLAYAPAIFKELGDHVVGPFVPLVATMLAFAILAVRRLLGPLERAAGEVDALDPSRTGQRLSVPKSPREARGLVLGFNRALDRTDHAIGQLKGFTAHVAHDLRTPLAILKLAVAEVQPEPLRKQLEDDLGSMTRLVNQLLVLVRAGALAPGQGREIDLGAIARDVVARMAPLAMDGGREIGVEDHGGDQSIVGEPEAVSAALRNLVENALKYGGQGPIEVIVGPEACISVRDHGPGIDEADAEVMFERFWRKGASGPPGAGLGLEIVRTITTAHGGKVSAANAPGGGALFTMDFRAAGPVAVWARPPPESAPAEAPA